MINFHILKGADCTIAAIRVSLEEASRFGTSTRMKTTSFTKFEEKPKKPKSTLASIG